MKNKFDISSFKYQKDEMDTLYKDILISEVIEKDICIYNNDTTNYYIESTQDSVNSWYKDETSNEIIEEKVYVTEIEQWDGEVISMNEHSFDAILSLQEYPNKRLVKINKNAVDKHTWKNMHEGSQFIWNFKTERTSKGTIRKNNQIFLKNELKMNMCNIQKFVEEEMKKFAYLFDND